jgi:hypothetical protein
VGAFCGGYVFARRAVGVDGNGDFYVEENVRDAAENVAGNDQNYAAGMCANCVIPAAQFLLFPYMSSAAFNSR